MSLFLLALIVLSPRDHPIAYLAGTGTNSLLATLGSNYNNYAAYVTAGFHSKQNGLGESLEWTSRRRFISSNDSLPLLKTNSLMR